MSGICVGWQRHRHPADRALALADADRAQQLDELRCRGSGWRAGGTPPRPRRIRRWRRHRCPTSWLACDTIVDKHRLEVERRADRPADLAERLQLVDGPRQIARPRLRAPGTGGRSRWRSRAWSGEGLEQRDLLVREQAHLGPTDQNRRRSGSPSRMERRWPRTRAHRATDSPRRAVSGRALVCPRCGRVTIADRTTGVAASLVQHGHGLAPHRPADRRQNARAHAANVLALEQADRRVDDGATDARGVLARPRRTPVARSVGELEMTRRISAVAVCCSSDSVSSWVRSSTLRSRPAYDSLSWPAMLLNWSPSASSSSPVRTSIRCSSSPAPIRAAPAWSAWIGVTIRRASTQARRDRQDHARDEQDDRALDRRVEARERLLERLLHEHRPARAARSSRRRSSRACP